MSESLIEAVDGNDEKKIICLTRREFIVQVPQLSYPEILQVRVLLDGVWRPLVDENDFIRTGQLKAYCCTVCKVYQPPSQMFQHLSDLLHEYAMDAVQDISHPKFKLYKQQNITENAQDKTLAKNSLKNNVSNEASTNMKSKSGAEVPNIVILEDSDVEPVINTKLESPKKNPKITVASFAKYVSGDDFITNNNEANVTNPNKTNTSKKYPISDKTISIKSPKASSLPITHPRPQPSTCQILQHSPQPVFQPIRQPNSQITLHQAMPGPTPQIYVNPQLYIGQQPYMLSQPYMVQTSQYNIESQPDFKWQQKVDDDKHKLMVDEFLRSNNKKKEDKTSAKLSPKNNRSKRHQKSERSSPRSRSPRSSSKRSPPRTIKHSGSSRHSSRRSRTPCSSSRRSRSPRRSCRRSKSPRRSSRRSRSPRRSSGRSRSPRRSSRRSPPSSNQRSGSPRRSTRHSKSPRSSSRRSRSQRRSSRRSKSPRRSSRRSRSQRSSSRRSRSQLCRSRRSRSQCRTSRCSRTPRPSSPRSQPEHRSSPRSKPERRPRSRSKRSPSPRPPSQRSPSPRLKSRRSPSPLRPSRRSRSQSHSSSSNCTNLKSQPSKDVWRNYCRLVDHKLKRLKEGFQQYKENPDSYPSYKEEWSNFFHRRRAEMKAMGKVDPNYDFQPDWILYFHRRIDQLCEEAFEALKIKCRKKFSLPLTNDFEMETKYYVHTKTTDIKEKKQAKESTVKAEPLSPSATSNISSTQSCELSKAKEDNDEFEEKTPMFISALRLLTALEEHLGSLGPKIVDLLTKALQAEKSGPSQILTLITKENCTLLETAMEKFKGLVIAGLLESTLERAVKKAIAKVTVFLEDAKKTVNQIPRTQHEMEKQIAALLIAQGKTNIDGEKLKQLATVCLLLDKKKREAAKNATTGNQASTFTLSDLIGSFGSAAELSS